MISKWEALSAHADKALAYLSCSYTLNHYLVWHQASGIDPNLGGVTSAKHQLWKAGRCCTEEQAPQQEGRTPLKVPEHTATERQTGFSSNSLTSMHRHCAFSI